MHRLGGCLGMVWLQQVVTTQSERNMSLWRCPTSQTTVYSAFPPLQAVVSLLGNISTGPGRGAHSVGCLWLSCALWPSALMGGICHQGFPFWSTKQACQLLEWQREIKRWEVMLISIEVWLLAPAFSSLIIPKRQTW